MNYDIFENIYFLVFALVAIIFSYRESLLNRSLVIKNFPIHFSRMTFLRELCLLIAIVCFFIALVDPKGSPKKSEFTNKVKKTIFVIDYSMSMRAEDVYPNRYKFGINFIRESIRSIEGHVIGVSIFSDKNFKLVPLTLDTKYIDSQLSNISDNLTADGGSNINIGVRDAIENFYVEGEGKINLVVLSDFESSYVDDLFSSEIVEKSNLYLIGVGTNNGGKIPVRKPKYGRIQYLRENNADIITKVNSKFISESSSNADVFTLDNNSFPIDSFISTLTKRASMEAQNKSNGFTAPRYFNYFLVVSILFYFLALVLQRHSKFYYFSWVLFLFFTFNISVGHSGEREYRKIKKGVAEKVDFLKHAESMINEKDVSEAIVLYEEQGISTLKEKEYYSSYFNYGTALLLSGNHKGLEVYYHLKEILTQSGEKSDMLWKINENILKFFKKKGGSCSRGNSQSDNKSDKSGKNNKNSSNQRGAKKKQQKNKNIAKDEILNKLIGDDKLSQGVYLKSKIKKDAKRGTKTKS